MGTFQLSELTNQPFLHKVNFAELELVFSQDSTLRDYQMANKRKIYAAWKNCRGVMLQMPTGTGKTRLFVSIVKDLHFWGARHKEAVKILILAHRKELIEQIDETLGVKYHQAHGIIMSQNMEQRKYPVQVGSVPTLTRRLDRWLSKDFDIIIIDEAHHVKAKSYKEIIRQYPNAKILGVTATPYRLNGAGFRPEFDELIVSDPVSKFIQKGYLCDYQYYSIAATSGLQAEIDTMKIDRLDGDYLDSEMMGVMDRTEIRAKIVSTYLKYAKGKRGIVYTVNKDHNRHIKEQFVAAGVNAEIVTNDTPKEQRELIVRRFRKGEIDVLCNVNIFSEGFDCPDIEFVQLARPTKSLAMYLQQVGRGLRPAEGKDRVIILDNVGLYNKFGFPSARRKWKYHFEGKNVPEEEQIRCDSEDDGFRDVLPIEEGDERVLLLHDSRDEELMDEKVEYQKTPVELIEVEKDLQELLANIEGLRIMEIPVPQDWLDKIEFYRNKLNPERVLEQELKELFRNFEEYKVDFEYHSVNKPSLEVEKQRLESEIEETKKSIAVIKSIVEKAKQLELSLPENLDKKRETYEKIIEACTGKLLFLDEVELLIQKYTKRQSLQIRSLRGNLDVIGIVESSPKELNDKTKKVDSASSGAIALPGMRMAEDAFGYSETIKNSNRLRIILPDGRVLEEKAASDTLVEFVKYVGIDRVRSLGLQCCNVPLVSDVKDVKYGSAQQPLGGGWFLMTNSPTIRKKRQAQIIADSFGINVKIE